MPFWQIGHEDVFAARRWWSRGRKHGKFWGTLGIGREYYLKVRALGAQLISPSGGVLTMTFGLKELAKTSQGPKSALRRLNAPRPFNLLSS